MEKVKFHDTEKWLERRAQTLIEEMGGTSQKWGTNANPDRIFFLPRGVIFFVEFKTKGNYLSATQLFRCRELQKLGANVHWCGSEEMLNEIFAKYENREKGQII